jgi:hypothetical protein
MDDLLRFIASSGVLARTARRRERELALVRLVLVQALSITQAVGL